MATGPEWAEEFDAQPATGDWASQFAIGQGAAPAAAQHWAKQVRRSSLLTSAPRPSFLVFHEAAGMQIWSSMLSTEGYMPTSASSGGDVFHVRGGHEKSANTSVLWASKQTTAKQQWQYSADENSCLNSKPQTLFLTGGSCASGLSAGELVVGVCGGGGTPRRRGGRLRIRRRAGGLGPGAAAVPGPHPVVQINCIWLDESV